MSLTSVVPRQTLFVLLTAVESDLRTAISDYLGTHKPADLLDPPVYERARDRYSRERNGADDPELDDLLPYLDFADAWTLLNACRIHLPAELGAYLQKRTPLLESLAPIRNRVAHARPLNFDDVARTMGACDELSVERPALWRVLKVTTEDLSRNPSSVLGVEIPEADDGRSHNLPIPDFDETGFVGRSEYVDRVVSLCQGPYPVITIKGDGGVGKTALALRVAYNFLDMRDSPFEAIAWATSKTTQLTPHEIRTIEGAIADSLGLIQALADNLSGIGDTDPFEEVLAYLREFKVLVVLDNLETVLDDRLRSFVAAMPSGSKLLITSRIGLGAYEHPVALSAMTSSEAVQLLRELSKVRGVQELCAMDNKKLVNYCERMHNSPGFIKWFVSAVQAGRRPEEILDRSGMFLDFCMSNVYGYLTARARAVLESMQCVPRPLSQAEIAFLNDLTADELQVALHALLATNMVLMKSLATGSSYESQYEVGELPRAYLQKHHPPSREVLQEFTRRQRELAAASEAIQRAQQSNPYLARSLDMRSRGNLIVARHLLDALRAVKDQRLADAEALCAEARRLAPEWFEVRRVEANVLVKQGNIGAAAEAFEAAKLLEPRSAPLRLWYALFLLNHMNDTLGAAKELEAAREIDPESLDVALQLGQTYLYLGRYLEAREALDFVLRSSHRLSGWKGRKAFDLHIRIYEGQAEAYLSASEPLRALAELTKLQDAFEAIPGEFLDEKLHSRLDYVVPLARRCVKQLSDREAKQRAAQLASWLLSSPRRGRTGAPPTRDGVIRGTVTKVVEDRGYGFVRSDEGLDYFCHVNGALAGGNGDLPLVGARLEFVPGRDAAGRLRALEWAAPGSK